LRGAGGADDLARRPLTVHAWDGLMLKLRIVGGAGVVAVNADPVQLSAAADLLGADNGDVVLRLAGDGARAAADAGCEIDRHPPLLPLHRAVFEKAEGDALLGPAGFMLCGG